MNHSQAYTQQATRIKSQWLLLGGGKPPSPAMGSLDWWKYLITAIDVNSCKGHDRACYGHEHKIIRRWIFYSG